MKKITSILTIIIFLLGQCEYAYPLAVRAAANGLFRQARLAEVRQDVEEALVLAREMQEVQDAIRQIERSINTAKNNPESQDNITPSQFLGKVGRIEQFISEHGDKYDPETIKAVSSVLDLARDLVGGWMQTDNLAHARLHPVVSNIKWTLDRLVLNKLLFEVEGRSLEELGFKEVYPGSGIYLSAGELCLVLTKPGDNTQTIKAVGRLSTGDPFEPSVFEEGLLQEVEPSSGIFLSSPVEGYRGCVVIDEGKTHRFIIKLSRNEGGFGFANDKNPKAAGFKLFYGTGRTLFTGAVLMEDGHGKFAEAFSAEAARQTETKIHTEVPIDLEVEETAVTPQVLATSSEINGVPVSELVKKAAEQKLLFGIGGGLMFKLEDGGAQAIEEVTELFINTLRGDSQYVIGEIGKSHQELAAALFYVFDLMDRYATDRIDEFVYNRMRFRVTRDLMMSSQTSIFGDGLTLPRYRVTVVNLDTGDSIQYWNMDAHYISRYGFYPGFSDGGFAPQRRLEPADINRIFFAPDEDNLILRARRGEVVTISSVQDIEKVINISQADRQEILPRLRFRITEPEMLESYSRLIASHPQEATQLIGNSAFRLAASSIALNYAEPAALKEPFLAIWEVATESIKDNLAIALRPIEISLRREYLEGVVAFLRKVGFDTRITGEIEIETIEKAQVFVNALIAHSDYGYNRSIRSEGENGLIADLIHQVLHRFDAELARVDDRPIAKDQRNSAVSIINNGFDGIWNFLPPLHIRANLQWRQPPDYPEDLLLAVYYTTAGEDPIGTIEKPRPVYLTGLGLPGNPRALFGIVDNYFYALDEEGNLKIVKAKNIYVAPRSEPLRPTPGAARGA